MATRQISAVWDRLNPSEPSPSYLLKLFAFMLGCFLIGLSIGGIPDERESGAPYESIAENRFTPSAGG